MSASSVRPSAAPPPAQASCTKPPVSGASFDSYDPREAAEANAQLFSPHRLTVLGPGMRLVTQAAGAGPVGLVRIAFGAEVAVDRPPVDSYSALLVPMRGAAFIRHGEEEFELVAGEGVAAISAGTSLHVQWQRDCTMVVMKAPATTLRRAALQLAPHAVSKEVRLTRSRITGPPADALVGVTQLAAHTFGLHERSTPDLGAPGSALHSADSLPAPVVRELGDQALRAILLGVPNNYSREIFAATPVVRQRSVRAAAELLATEPAAMFTVADLARHAHVTVRALELAFQRELRTTPHAYMQRVRLMSAHQELSRSTVADGTTVTAVATRWGFANAGRFASRYRSHFGVMPSETLRRTLDHST